MPKKYHISTIANLLLDMDYSIEESLLQQENLEKGIQTMINEAQHHGLVAALHNYTCKTAAGGACTNSIYAAASLGAKTFVNGRIGHDTEGDNLLTSLKSANISTTSLEKLRSDGHTGKCLVLVTPDAERTMMTYLGVSADIPMSCIEIQSLLDTEFFLIEGFQCIPELTRQTSIKAIQMAKSAGAKIVLSLCDEAIVEYFHDQISEIMGITQVDILFCNEHEAMGLTRTKTTNDAITALQSMVKQAVVTRGPNGAIVWDGSSLFNIPGIPSCAVDTTGAGDIFVGVFLWALTSGFSHQSAGELANKAAAKLVGKIGPRLTQLELKGVFAEFQHNALKIKEQVDVVG